ncbi:MAG TPA: MATE family efflux transporter [Chitinophagaceae bacterium]|nr:MATE family efflux transporter [Chitinophagaceae bacterium]
MQNQTVHKNQLSHFFSLVRRSIRGDEYDYTQGSIRAAIVLLAVPMILELVLESVFAVVDMYFVSHMHQGAKQAMATVGLTESVISIVYTLGFGVSMAATAVVARRIGEKNNEGAAHAGAQAILIGIAVSVVLSIAGVIFAPSVLKLMGAAPDVIAEGAPFARIMFGSSLVIIMLFLINGVYRGAGDAAMAMRSLWIASGINIILCPLLIYGYGPFPELGLKGAAIATVIGRSTGVIYQCYHLFGGKRIIHLVRHHFKWDAPVIKTLVEVAWPATSQFFIQSGSWIVLSYLVSKTGSTDASAGYQVAIRNVVFFILPAWGLSNAAATLVGQNLGAKQPERAAKSVLLTTKYNAVFMGIVMLLFLFLASPIMSIFTKEAEVHRYGVSALQIIGAGYIFYGIGMVMIQALNGAGDSKTPTIINLFGFWFFQIPLAWILAKGFDMGPVGAFIAIPVAESFLALAAWYYFKLGKWKEVKI